MSATIKDVKKVMYEAGTADEAKNGIRRMKDFDDPKTAKGIKKNIYDFIQTDDDKFFKQIEKHFVEKAKTEKIFMYASDRKDMTQREQEMGTPNTKPKMRVGGMKEVEASRTETQNTDDEVEALMRDTKQSIDELTDLMGQVDQLKQDEANIKAEIDRTKDDVKRDDLKKNMDELVLKRRATEETAQLTLNEIKRAPEKMDELDKSKVSEMENMIKDVSEMGRDRPTKAEPKQTVDVDPTMDTMDEEKFFEAPTMSPDEIEEVAEGLRKASEEAEKLKAKEEEEERARVRRELGEREARRREAPQVTPTKGKDGPEMKITRSKASTVPDDIQPLPMERISTRNKNLAELLDDLKYFFNTYPDTLRRDTEKYDQLDKMSMPLVERFHKMIVGKLYDPEKSKKRVGIILDAREYIAQQVNDILAKRATDGLKPEEIVSITDPEKKSDSKDFGNYEVKEGRQGGVQFLRREPLYRLMPESNDKNVYPMEAKAKKGRLRVGPPPTRNNSVVQNAKVEFKQNPFTEPKKDIIRLQF